MRTGGNEAPITTDGSEKDRIKYGTASWVYGEELRRRTAMWWSPDSTQARLLPVRREAGPRLLTCRSTRRKLQSKVDVEAYPKAGAPNPIVDLFVYDVATKKTTRVDVRDGKPFDNTVVGHYVYHVAWSPDGKELLFNRTNRRQNVLELAAANPATGATPGDRARGVADRLDREQARHGVPRRTASASSGSRSATAGRTSISTISTAGSCAPLTTHTAFEVGEPRQVDEPPVSSSTPRATATTT